MAGTKEGARKGTATKLAKDPGFFSRIGTVGGRTTSDKPQGFAARPDVASRAGKIGGRIGKPYTHKPRPTKST